MAMFGKPYQKCWNIKGFLLKFGGQKVIQNGRRIKYILQHPKQKTSGVLQSCDLSIMYVGHRYDYSTQKGCGAVEVPPSKDTLLLHSNEFSTITDIYNLISWR